MKKLLFPLFAIAIACTTTIVSCSKDNEQDITNNNPNPPDGGNNSCDTANMQYTRDVLPIISGSCYSCHGNGNVSGGVSLGNYAGLKTQADNGNLLHVINHDAGYPAMPQGGSKLSDCNINKIRSWINHGALNN
ncbi:c-type cytochrome [Chitinophaga ginsengisoli]|uniref:Cbb3-type cytochrome c oxidase subunit III n=1 Tax=Chitinophaga ginsengisoli TaxID=363837 RepID=A0A2P8GDE7_9BACT|nr:cytochrome c [Chitinophaga ginsengisoli]PSL31982.1 cbb3-type cytochrome c oxidase subunit III [Chitinophaga ginsengisoli]